jgi:membrane protease YdiL (CAAX protease family)
MKIRQRWFWFGCAIEGLLAALALGLGWLLDQPPGFRWSLTGAVLGFLAAAPLLALFQRMLRSRGRWLHPVREFMEDTVRPVFQDWSLWQLALVSLLAGVGEEWLFRAVIQGWLSHKLGPLPGLGLASVLFGLAHLVNWTYSLLACVIGAYLGLLWLASGNLLVPITTHAVYDLAALICFVRGRITATRN